MGFFTKKKKCILTAALFLFFLPYPARSAQQPAQVPTFPVAAYLVEGNTILSPDDIQHALVGLIGPTRTSADVEKARGALEKLYHSRGYPTVLVSVPQQSVKGGIIRLAVTESKTGEVKTVGNRYVTREKLMKSLPSLKPGTILYAPEVEKEFARVNKDPDMKATPALSMGNEPGTIDVTLNVKDQIPLHSSLELSNWASPNTTSLRLNAVIHYDNLWQLDHSLSLQYQTSPEDPNEVEVGAASYMLPAPWNENHQILVSGIWSDSNTAFGEGFTTVGKGHQFGLRYILPLPSSAFFGQNVILGLDYKDFQNIVLQASQGNITNPAITYFPLSFVYNSYLRDRLGLSQFTAGVNMAFRGLISNEAAFAGNRYDAQGNYLYATGCVERTQDLIGGAKLHVKAGGQISEAPLINNEEYAAGGMGSVRGYYEAEELGDNAVHCTVELCGPEMVKSRGFANGKIECTPYIFYDMAHLYVLDPLPGQQNAFDLEGTGFGVRGCYDDHLEYDTSWGEALSSTQYTKSGDSMVNFMVKYFY